MTEQTIKFRDPLVKNVVNKFVKRSDVGFEKYSQTLDTERKTGMKDLIGYKPKGAAPKAQAPKENKWSNYRRK